MQRCGVDQKLLKLMGAPGGLGLRLPPHLKTGDFLALGRLLRRGRLRTEEGSLSS